MYNAFQFHLSFVYPVCVQGGIDDRSTAKIKTCCKSEDLQQVYQFGAEGETIELCNGSNKLLIYM